MRFIELKTTHLDSYEILKALLLSKNPYIEIRKHRSEKWEAIDYDVPVHKMLDSHCHLDDFRLVVPTRWQVWGTFSYPEEVPFLSGIDWKYIRASHQFLFNTREEAVAYGKAAFDLESHVFPTDTPIALATILKDKSLYRGK